MTTEKRYYQDQYKRIFSANIIKQSQDENGRHFVILDKTYFYPTGGGQPHDIGYIDDVSVYDVEEVEGEVRHYIDQPIEETSNCQAEIDWDRRFDHMQQHAGQHILSASFDDIFGYKTVSFHLGQELCSIDITTEKLSKDVTSKVETASNNVILENRPIEIKWVSQEELAQYSLRKKLSVSDNIRLVIIPDFDYSGCGGTHPKETGQVSAIKILHWEKQKKNTRVYFVCGNRVMNQLHKKHGVIQDLTAMLSTPQEQLGEAVTRIIEQTKVLEKIVDTLKSELLVHEADKLVGNAQSQQNFSLITEIFDNRPIAELQQLARDITTKQTNMLVVFINELETKLQVICAASEDTDVNCNKLIKEILSNINGKGGGKPTLAQGGGEKILSAAELMEKATDQVACDSNG